MKLVLVSYYFPPHRGIGGKRIARWSRRLPSFGVTPLVLTTPEPPAALRDPSPPDTRGAEVFREYCPGWAFQLYHGTNETVATATEDARAGAPSSAWARGLARLGDAIWRNYPIDPNVWFVPFAARAAWRLAREHGARAVLVSSAPYSSLLVGMALARLGLPWIADFRDPWSFNFGQEVRSAIARRADARLEEAALRSASWVLFANDNARRRYVEMFPWLAAKCETLYSGFDPAPVEARPWPVSPRPRVALVHFGDFYGPRRLGVLVDAVAAVARARRLGPQDLGFLLLGRPPAEDLARAEALGVREFFTALPQRPYAEGLGIVAGADALLYCDFHREQYFIGGKLFDYLRARRPIVAMSASAETRGLIEGHGVGRVSDPDDQAGIEAQLCALLDGAFSYTPRDLSALSEESSARRLAEIAGRVGGRGA